VEKEFEESRGRWCNASTHVTSAFGNNTNGSGTFIGGCGRSEFHNGFLEDFPELRERCSEGSGKANHDVEGGVDYEPIIFRFFL